MQYKAESMQRYQVSESRLVVSTLCDPMDCSPPGSSHGILQARILEWAAIPFSGDLPKPGIEPSSPVLSSFSFASFWSLPDWGLWELCVCVTASTIPLHFSLGWI